MSSFMLNNTKHAVFNLPYYFKLSRHRRCPFYYHKYFFFTFFKEHVSLTVPSLEVLTFCLITARCLTLLKLYWKEATHNLKEYMKENPLLILVV